MATSKKVAKAIPRQLLKIVGGMLGTAAVRSYVNDRLSSVPPDKLIDSIERMDVDIFKMMTERERKAVTYLLRNYRSYLHLLNAKAVMAWLIEDKPFLAGVIYGHPKGIEWLYKVLDNVKNYAEDKEGKYIVEVVE